MRHRKLGILRIVISNWLLKTRKWAFGFIKSDVRILGYNIEGTLNCDKQFLNDKEFHEFFVSNQLTK